MKLFLALSLSLPVWSYSTNLNWDSVNPKGTTFAAYRMTGSCPPMAPTSTLGFTKLQGNIKGTYYKDITVKEKKSYCYIVIAVPKVGPPSVPSNPAQVKIP